MANNNTMLNNETTVKKSKIMRLFDGIPDALVLLIALAFLAMILTWIVPSGEFNRILNEKTGVMMVDGESFTFIDSSPQYLISFATSIFEALMRASGIIFYLFIVGGAMSVIMATGAIDSVLGKALVIAEKRPGFDKVILVVIIAFFAFCSSTFGMTAETLIFLPIILALCRTLKYDAIVAVAISYMVCAFGYACATTNAFNVGVAQKIAELPMSSGVGFRAIFAIVSMTVTTIYILNYANKVKKDPTKSLVHDVDYSDLAFSESAENIKFTPQKLLVILLFIGALFFLVYGSIKYALGFKQLSALFFGVALISCFICGIKPGRAAKLFTEGAEKMTYACLLTGIAQALLVVMEKGKIIDTIIYYLVQPLSLVPKGVAAIFMMLIQTVLNVFIPSGSGQAMVTMPIMVPIADILELNRQVAVFAFQIGDGFGNVILPTVGVMLAIIALARIPLGRWVAFAAKLVAIQYVIGGIFLYIANSIGYGPF